MDSFTWPTNKNLQSQTAIITGTHLVHGSSTIYTCIYNSNLTISELEDSIHTNSASLAFCDHWEAKEEERFL